MPSQAYADFLGSLDLAKSLLVIELRYSDPPKRQNQKKVEALRGGATVLMVAAFENFLQELVIEHLSNMTTVPIQFNTSNVSPETKIINIERRLAQIQKAKKLKN